MSSQRQYHSERVVQTVNQSGGSHYGSNDHQLDNNLDNLLEDLQKSVSRPSSALAMNGSGLHSGNYREFDANTSGKTTKSRHVEYLSAANPVVLPSETSSSTVIREEAKERDGNTEKTIYKTIKYEYDVSDGAAVDNNEQFRMQSNINQLDSLLDDLQQVRKGANYNAGIDPGLLDPVETTRQITKKSSVQRELVYGTDAHQQQQQQQVATTTPISSHRSRSRTQASPAALRRNEREGSVTREITTSYHVDDGSYGSLRHASPTSHREIIRKEEILPPEILHDLDPNLHPNPNTKVTTTIKTYTYEVPGTVPVVNTTTNQYQWQSQKNILNNTNDTHYTYNVSPSPTNLTNSQRMQYREDIRTTSKHGDFVHSRSPSPQRRSGPGAGPGPGSGSGPNISTIRSYDDDYRVTSTPNYGHPRHPDPNYNVSYEYASQRTASNTYRTDDDSHLHPIPFPTEPTSPRPVSPGPPKHLNELMASFNDTNYNVNRTTTTTTNVHNNNYINRNASQTTVHHPQHPPPPPAAPIQETMKKDLKDVPKSKNVAGPPVYYPPGHELFAKKEESSMAASSQGGGGYMKASGKYKYEAESKSKSKSKSSSGAAVVPVCLPLCCALPCVLL